MTQQVPEATDTAAMRALADMRNAEARDAGRAQAEAAREARQLAWEADLIDQRDLCAAELEGNRGYLARLQDAVTPLVAAERKAEDRLRADQEHLERRQAEAAKLEADYAPAEQQEQAAIRVQTAERVVARGVQEVASATAARQAAQAAVTAQQAAVTGLEREHAAADRKARNPGRAPGGSPFAPGISGINDMDEDARKAIAALALLGGLSLTSGQTEPKPDDQRDPSGLIRKTLPDGRTLMITTPAGRR